MNYTERNNYFINKIPLKYRIEFKTRFVLEHFFGKLFPKAIRTWDQKIQTKIYQSIKNVEKEEWTVAEFESNVDPNQLRKEYVRKGIPVIIRNGAESWKAFKDWDFEFFKKEYGDHPVILANHEDLGEEKEEASETNLRAIIEGIDHNSMKYARFNPLLDAYPELQEDLDQGWLNQMRDTKIKKHHVLFIGNKGTKTNIHNAGNDNIFVQIRGSKRWLLWHQDAFCIFNPKVNRAPAKASPVNPEKEFEDENLLYNHLPFCELTLNPGDILLVPAYLWHYVENKTPTIGIGIRWLSPHNTLFNNPVLAILEIFNTSPSLFTTLDWRKGFDFNKIMLKNKAKTRKN